MSSKITIIGAGSVGSTIAYTLSSQDIASEIVLIDINKKKAEGEVLDIIQGTCFRDPISIIAGDYEDARDSDIVIITSGIARKPGQTRLELTQTNVNILKSITPEIVKAAPNALYLIVSNPVDIMTYVFTKISGLPENQILGSGTILDSARLRCGLSEHFQIAQSNIHAYVFGEHGDTSFIPWSGAYISGVSVDEYYDLEKKLGKDIEPIDKEAMLQYVQKSGGEIISKKGATFYAVSSSVCKLCSLLVSSSESISTVSTMMHGEYGIDDVCLSTLTLVGPNGVQGKVPMRMTKAEIEQLKKSADALKEIHSTPAEVVKSMETPRVPVSALFLVLCGLCTSVMWGGIFNLAVEGLGKYTAQASGIFMMMVVGGGIFPLLQQVISDAVGYMASYWLIVAMLAYLLFYGVTGCKNVNKDIPVE